MIVTPSLKVSLSIQTFFIILYIFYFSARLIFIITGVQTAKTTAIRLIDVRETRVSRHHRVRIEVLRTSQHYHNEGFKGGGLNWAPLYRETPASRTANVGFSSVMRAWFCHDSSRSWKKKHFVFLVIFESKHLLFWVKTLAFFSQNTWILECFLSQNTWFFE